MYLIWLYVRVVSLQFILWGFCFTEMWSESFLNHFNVKTSATNDSHCFAFFKHRTLHEQVHIFMHTFLFDWPWIKFSPDSFSWECCSLKVPQKGPCLEDFTPCYLNLILVVLLGSKSDCNLQRQLNPPVDRERTAVVRIALFFSYTGWIPLAWFADVKIKLNLIDQLK